jgi:hypothetical protein
MQVNGLLQAAAPGDRADALDKVNGLLDGLDTLLLAEGLIAR